MRWNKLLATFVVITMFISAGLVMKLTNDAAADYVTGQIPGVRNWGNATTDLVYHPTNKVDFYIDTSGLDASSTYYLQFPIYKWTAGTGYNLTWSGAFIPSGAGGGQYARIETSASPDGATARVKPEGMVVHNISGMWVFTKRISDGVATQARAQDQASFDATIGAWYWVNTSSDYSIGDFSDFDYGANVSHFATVSGPSGSNIDVRFKDQNTTIYHGWFGNNTFHFNDYTYANSMYAGNYTITAYNDLDATDVSAGYGTSSQGYTQWYGGNPAISAGLYNHAFCGPWDPPELNATEKSFVVRPGTISTSIPSANQTMYWGSYGQINVSVKDTSGDPLLNTDYNVYIFNRNNKNITANFSGGPNQNGWINKSTGYCHISSLTWGMNGSHIYGTNGSWYAYISVDKNGDMTWENKEWNEEWNATINFRVQKSPGVQFQWVDDDGNYSYPGAVANTPYDGVIPYIPPIANVPLWIQFQLIGDDHTYFGDADQKAAKENITFTGNALFTGTLDTIPGVSYSGGTWRVPVIPTMSKTGGTITISGTWSTTSKNYGTFKETLDVGGSKYSTNGTIVSVTPNKFAIGTDQIHTVTVTDADGIPYKWANVALYYIDQGGTPATVHLLRDQIGGGTTDGKYSLEFNKTQQMDNQTSVFGDIRAPRNLTVYVTAANAGYGYALIQMSAQSNLQVEVFPETWLAGWEYGMFYINTSVVTTGNTTLLPNEDEYGQLTIQILNEEGKDVTNSIGASFTFAQINNDNEIGKDYVVDMPNAYITKAGTYTVRVYNYTSNSNGYNATLVVKQATVDVDKTPLVWKSDNNISATFTVTGMYPPTGETMLLNGTLLIDNMTWDSLGYNKTWTNCSFDGSVDQGGNNSVYVGESEGFVNGKMTIQDITANYLPTGVAYKNVTFWFKPLLSDGSDGRYARAAGILPVSVPSITPDKTHVSVGKTTTVTTTVTARGELKSGIYVRLHGLGIDTNGTSDIEGKVVFSILPTSTGNISIDVGEEGRTIDDKIIVTSWVLDISADQTDVDEGGTFTVTVMKEGSTNYIEGADVTFNAETKQTDENGQVTFTAPAVTSDRTFTITVSKTGYAADPDGLSITVINVPKLTIVIPSEKVYSGQTFQITIAEDTGQAVIGATVTFNGATYTTQANGVATLTAPEVTADSTAYTISCTFPGFADAATVSITIYKSPGIPGFELITLIIAIGVAFILIRKRRH